MGGYFLKKSMPSKPGGVLAPSRRLAMALEEICPPEKLAKRLDKWARGIDPDAKPGQGYAPIPYDIRFRAEAIRLERQVGKAKSHVVLEGNVNHAVDARVTAFAVDIDTMRRVLGDKAEEFRELQDRLARATRKALKEKVREYAELTGEVIDIEDDDDKDENE